MNECKHEYVIKSFDQTCKHCKYLERVFPSPGSTQWDQYLKQGEPTSFTKVSDLSEPIANIWHLLSILALFLAVLISPDLRNPYLFVVIIFYVIAWQLSNYALKQYENT